jgi:hypothetical protein
MVLQTRFLAPMWDDNPRDAYSLLNPKPQNHVCLAYNTAGTKPLNERHPSLAGGSGCGVDSNAGNLETPTRHSPRRHAVGTMQSQLSPHVAQNPEANPSLLMDA